MMAGPARWMPRQLLPGRFRDAVVTAVAEATERARRVQELKDRGHWLDIPFDAEHVREAAKDANAVYDGDRKQWAFPDADSLARVTELRDVWITDTDEEKRLAVVAAERRRQAEEERRALERRERIVAGSDRTPTGEVVEHREISTRHMNRHTAEDRAREDGSLVYLDDGRRGVVVDRKIWFTGEDMASSVCWHQETHDEAHWDFQYTVLVVEDTEEEKAADAERAAQRADALAIHAVVDKAPQLTGATAGDYWTDLPVDQRVGTIDVTTGTTGTVRAGQLVLTRDGRVVWQHPGYYDDYIRSEGVSTDPDLVVTVRALFAPGPRKRVVRGTMPTYYEVRTASA